MNQVLLKPNEVSPARFTDTRVHNWGPAPEASGGVGLLAAAIVQLVATPDDGYQFGSWSGDIATIANPSAPSTSITMNGNYAILANFETEGGAGPTEPTQPS